mmetsp:Transcript_7381/g.9646  ORF Transcript_7381/g.9646 Transcript_7381/m.9646 type:complete len:404 (-) Transcript_7381:72-1283(-)|eukprot:CAMPEP_0184035012 /NCGR_PEP_ID=MMETSP0955-20130417/22407_1 /TAXON_ID=627963 /ORGANISM="Aplanochytrium sp, Strain PBS07" /LENGTH=403 /DNA_ID=CAMNT_0026321985 /DNA_START=209 /DNA_END=1420 /DNA_ORIENTATION=+
MISSSAQRDGYSQVQDQTKNITPDSIGNKRFDNIISPVADYIHGRSTGVKSVKKGENKYLGKSKESKGKKYIKRGKWKVKNGVINSRQSLPFGQRFNHSNYDDDDDEKSFTGSVDGGIHGKENYASASKLESRNSFLPTPSNSSIRSRLALSEASRMSSSSIKRTKDFDNLSQASSKWDEFSPLPGKSTKATATYTSFLNKGNQSDQETPLLNTSRSRLQDFEYSRFSSPCYEVNVQAESIDSPDGSGWLHVSSTKGNAYRAITMKRRFVVIKNNLLYIYRKDFNERPIFVALLDGAVCKRLDPSEFVCKTIRDCKDAENENTLSFYYGQTQDLDADESSSGPYITSVTTNASRMFYVSFTSDEDCSQWSQNIENAGYDKLLQKKNQLEAAREEYCSFSCNIL